MKSTQCPLFSTRSNKINNKITLTILVETLSIMKVDYKNMFLIKEYIRMKWRFKNDNYDE